MTPLDVFNSSKGLSEFLTKLYGPTITTSQRTDGTNMYNTFMSIKRSSSSSSSSGSGSGSTDEGDKSVFSKIFSGLDNFVKGAANVGNNIYKSQLGQEDSNLNTDAIQKLFDIVKGGGLNPLKLIYEGLTVAGKEIIDQLKQESELRDQINSATNLTGNLSQALRDDIVMSSVSAAKYGFSMKEVGDLYTDLVGNSGKFALINSQTMDDAAPVVRAFGSTMSALSDTISEFEKVGIGANQTIKAINDAGIRSMSLGMSGKKIVTDIQTNIGKLNEYGFKNGVQGLETMVRKSNEFRISMDSVFGIAEKVMNPESAIELSANLQVLGGAIGDFNDPLKLMYMATNNVEGLQDALIGAASNLATYNTEQGKFEITGVNLRRAQEMAKQLGVEYKELSKGAIAAAERSSAASALMLRGFEMKDEDKEFLTNISRMEGGEMKIVVPKSLQKELGDVPISLDKITEDQKDFLIKNREAFKSMDSKEVAMQQLTETQQMARDMSVVAAYYKVRGAQMLAGAAKGSGFKKEMENLKATIGGYSSNVLEKRNDTGYQKRVEEGVSNFIDSPIKTTKNFIKSKLNPEEKETPKETAMNTLTKEDLTISLTSAFVNAFNQTKYNTSNSIANNYYDNTSNPDGYA